MAGTRDYGASSVEGARLLPGGPDDVGLGGGPTALFVPLKGRVRRDNGWTAAWVVVYLATLAAGVGTFLNRNVNFATEINPDYLNDPSHCPADAPSMRRGLLGMRSLQDEGGALSVDEFTSVSLYWLLGSVVGALLTGLLFVVLVTRMPRAVVGLAIGLQIGLPLVAGTSLMLGGTIGGGVPLLLLAGMTALLFWLWREQLDLVCQLLGVSGHGLSENLGLIGAAIGIHAGLMLMSAPLLVSMISAVTNGHVAYNAARAPGGALPPPGGCVDSQGDQVTCCVWEVDSHVAPVITLASLTMLWTSFIGGQVRTFTVSATVAQWYFAPVADQLKPARSHSRVGDSLRGALGPAFGSLCFGALVLTVVDLMRSALEELRKKAQENVLLYCLFVLVQFLFTLVEMVTKFATVRIAITGEAFWPATRGVASLLQRTFLDTFGVWWFPPMILQMCAFVLSGAWAAGVFFAARATWSSLENGAVYAGLVAAVGFFLSWLVLSFFVCLLLDIVDAVYLCFAMDRDAGEVSRADVHAIYMQLPCAKNAVVVEQPGGEYAYAEAGPQQHQGR